MVPIRFTFVLLGVVLLGSCDLIASLPVITPDPVLFPSASPIKVMTARITRRGVRMEDTGLTVTCTVSLRLTPNRVTAPVIVRAIQGSGTTWACNLPAGFAIRPNQVLQFQWLVSSDTTPLADSGRREQMLDCRNPVRAMIAEQGAVLSRFGGAMTHEGIIRQGFVPTHGFTSYQGMGVAFIRARSAGTDLVSAASNAMVNLGSPTLGTPDLLLFRPAGGSVTDAGGPDNPYMLVGWAYAQSIRPFSAQPFAPTGAPAAIDPRPIQRRPLLRCVPHHEWFLHAAGIHRPDGTFAPRPTPLPAGLGELPPVFHPDLWDIHFFVGVDGAAKTGILNPGGPALSGVAAPANSFYYPTAYD